MNQNQFPKKVSSLLDLKDKYQAFFFDMDGVFWNGSQKIQNAVDSFNQLKNEGKKCFFITNNSSQSRKTYVDKLKNYGVEIEYDKVFAASSIAAYYIKNKLEKVKKCYVVGMQGICEELDNYNIPYIWSHDVHQQSRQLSTDDFNNLELDKDVGAVVVGIDYQFNYLKMAYASRYIQEGSIFIATNEDKYIMVGNKKMPGGGTIVNAIAISCDQRPLVTGKPNPFVIELLCQQHNIDKSQALMIGDNLETDIQLGVNAGLDTLLVLSGVTSQENLQFNYENQLITPNFYSNTA